MPPGNYDDPVWQQEAGPTVWGIFGSDSEMFGRREQQWMVSFRVRDLDATVSELQAADIPVEVDPERYPNGRFSRLADPDGNPIQLWEPR
jgi:glyoxylase I family protein